MICRLNLAWPSRRSKMRWSVLLAVWGPLALAVLAVTSAEVKGEEPAPFRSALITPWGESLTEANAWREYPRPQMVRKAWKCLNGYWQWAVTSDQQASPPDKWEGRILVPFAIESKLGGVQRLLKHDEALWYRRVFEYDIPDGHRLLLHFEAVDYRTTVFVNGKEVGRHVGGFTPFYFDITLFVKPGPNELVVRVEDETEEWQIRGKQVRKPRGIWYTRVSGIWQTVWLEPVPSTYISDISLHTDPHSGTITAALDLGWDGGADWTVRMVVQDAGRVVAEGTGTPQKVECRIEKPKLWTPDSPNLYDLIIEVRRGDMVVDRIRSYAGIRSVGRKQDAQGAWRLALNGKILFQIGPLDQGWWPDGLLTPP